jgi:hypothetical protein
MARGSHGLPKVLLGSAMPNHSTPCRRPLLKRPYGHFRVAACRAGGLRLSYYFLGYPTRYASDCNLEVDGARPHPRLRVGALFRCVEDVLRKKRVALPVSEAEEALTLVQ